MHDDVDNNNIDRYQREWHISHAPLKWVWHVPEPLAYRAREGKRSLFTTTRTTTQMNVVFTTHFSLTLVASGRYSGFVLVLWLKLPAWKVGDSGFVPRFGIQVSKKKAYSTLTSKDSVLCMGSHRDQEVACSASDCQCSNFESCAWSSHLFHHPQEVLRAQFRLYVHKEA